MGKSAIMSRAWAIFRERYNYPAIPFRSIGRPCFAWALCEAWREARDAAAVWPKLNSSSATLDQAEPNCGELATACLARLNALSSEVPGTARDCS